MEKKITGWNYFSLGLCAFGGLGIEMVYILLEPLLYGKAISDWNSVQVIMHWILTCVTWVIIGYQLVKISKKKYQFNVFEIKEKIKKWQWILVVFCIIFTISLNYISWNGFKIVREFQGKGFLLFLFQHIYYVAETILFTLIIVFSQKAFEIWLQKKNIPYGGIVCGITWGFVHTFTKGSILIGLEGIAIGFLYGIVYLLLNRDIKKTYLVLTAMFIL